jgi:plastocyanin
MTFRTVTEFHSLAATLTAALCAAAVPACSHRPAELAAGAAPAPAPGGAARADTTRTDSAVAAGRTDTSAAPTAAPAPAAADSQYLKYDAATNTVTFLLVAGPFSFNGFTGGGATLTVPARSNNVINFEQNDGTPHSAEIASGEGPVPNSGGNPAIPRAYTNKVVEGLPQGATDVMKFTAPDSGTYRIICGVPGHALSGMWIWYKVDPAAKTPSFGAKK